MKTKELIKQLQELVDLHEPMVEVFGEHEVVIDSWELLDTLESSERLWQYKGFSTNVEITLSGDGVYHILAAAETWA